MSYLNDTEHFMKCLQDFKQSVPVLCISLLPSNVEAPALTVLDHVYPMKYISLILYTNVMSGHAYKQE